MTFGSIGGRGSLRGGSTPPRCSAWGFTGGASPGSLSLTLRPSLVVSSGACGSSGSPGIGVIGRDYSALAAVGRSSTVLPEPAGQLGARRDAQLAVDVGEVALDGLRRDEEPGGDLLGLQALGDQLGHAALGRRERSRGGLPPSDAGEFRVGAALPDARAERVEAGGGGLQSRACGRLLPRTTQRGAVGEPGAGQLERDRDGLVEC